jgi:hypothetical protein
MRRTPPRPLDVEALFPELAPLRRTAVRLHPRAGDPGRRDSSVGGPLLWPAAEAWPVCGAAHFAWYAEPGGRSVPLVPVVQVFRGDAPAVRFPEGTDLLQVLWCPCVVEGCENPGVRVLWRDSAAVGALLDHVPVPDREVTREATPRPCVVHPEEVVEYPGWDLPAEVADGLRRRFDRLEEETGWLYWYHLASAPGTKIGGYPGWTQEPCWPDCDDCGHRMRHLLTVSRGEFDGESWHTWLPREDRAGATGREPRHPTAADAVANPADLVIGDGGGVYVFQCPDCPSRPVTHGWDCS